MFYMVLIEKIMGRKIRFVYNRVPTLALNFKTVFKLFLKMRRRLRKV